MSKKKNKNSVTNVNTNNEEGRIMSMLNGMMNGYMNGGGNIMNNQFTNPNIATQAQHVLNQTAASGNGQVQYGYVPVDIPQQQQTQGTVFQQAQFVDPNAQQNAQAQTQQQNSQQQGFTNPNNASQAQFVDPNAQQNAQAQTQQQNSQQQGFTNPNNASQAQFVDPNAQENTQQQGFTNPKNQNEQVNDNKEDNIMNTENTNETSTSIIEDHPFISTALGIVGGILLGKFFFGSDDSSSDVITIDTTATDDSI